MPDGSETWTVKEESYKGWAGPSFLSSQFIGTLEERKAQFSAARQERIEKCGKSIEELIYSISSILGYPTIGCDQWWGFWVNGSIGNIDDYKSPDFVELELSVFIQSDDFMMGLIETYEVCKRFWEQHTGRKWEW